MVYQWFVELSDQISFLNVFRYITFRAFISFFTAFIVCLGFGPAFIRRMQRKQMKQTVRDDGPESHLKKQGTPTMGGKLMLIGLVPVLFSWLDLSNGLVVAALGITLGFGFIGYLDDFMKVSQKIQRGSQEGCD